MNDMRPGRSSPGGAAAAQATPVMAQYLEVKAAHPGSLLFYRMGDFYELFFADAEIAAACLGIALTRRGRHLGEDIPMCGVPVHAADGYLQRLIRAGHKVAVCEQLEDPAEARKRGSKSVVHRDVVRLVTPGTLTEDTLLEARSHNFLAALTRIKASGDLGLAWADISSGDLVAMATSADRFGADLARLGPREILVPDSLLDDPQLKYLLEQAGAVITPLPPSRFDSDSGERRLNQQFGVATLQAFGSFGRAEIAALGGLLDYITITQAGKLPHLRIPRREEPSAALLIDAATRANLELTQTLAGERKGSLLAAIDLTITAAGGRALAQRLSNPLADPETIGVRLDEVSYFSSAASLRVELREELAAMPDMARALSRLSVGRGGPRDLASIRDGLACAAGLALKLGADTTLATMPPSIQARRREMAGADLRLIKLLDAALADTLPLLARDGGFVRPGYSADLDQALQLRDESRGLMAELQAKYAEAAGVKSLKVRHNNVLGYFIEVSSQNAGLLKPPAFIHRQTIANAVRFVTAELTELEQKIATAADRALALEQEIFAVLVGEVTSRREVLSTVADSVAAIDVATGLAELAGRHRYVRPLVDSSFTFDIKAGRHPVVEQALLKETSSFVPNTCNLTEDDNRIQLMTGPNMAGKSTYLRQNALIVILAQMGSFVPAEAAHIGIVDRLFSRVGAADDLARGRSTFMVEMVETAAILNQATPRSFVILDEIGRGTATYDGLSIAWAVIEHLHEVNKCRALFATHYHELTALSSRLSHLANAAVKVREWQGEVIFLHEVVAGVADRSYGIQVARLAGIPQAVTVRASEILNTLEQGKEAAGLKDLFDDLPLFSAAQTPQFKASEPSELERLLASVAPDELSPREALELVYALRKRLPDRSCP